MVNNMKNKEKYDLRDISYVIKSNNGKYEFVVYYNFIEIHREIFYGFVSTHDTFTKWLEEEYVPDILTDKEKDYLSAVIKPFREKVEYVYKICLEIDKREYLEISLENGVISFPYFEKDTMYKGMKYGKRYTLEELGL
jgi:hypothetical protein